MAPTNQRKDANTEVCGFVSSLSVNSKYFPKVKVNFNLQDALKTHREGQKYAFTRSLPPGKRVGASLQEADWASRGPSGRVCENSPPPPPN